MTLNSIYFIPFFIAVLTVSGVLQLICGRFFKNATQTALKSFLCAVSLFFIFLSGGKCAIVIIATILFDYFFAILLQKNPKKQLLAVGIVLLCAELGCFKYFGFFLGTVSELLEKDFVLYTMVLPVGISFYIFTSIGYLIDVYRGDYPAERNILNVSLMICLFTKVLSGPIVRGKDFLPKMRGYKGINSDNLLRGVQLFVFGLFKKIVLADHLGVFVNDVFHAPTAFGTGTVILAVISYSLQIYFDFSGYSDMAIGTSQMLGITIAPNFNLPYIAKNPSEFWGRWHISLSSWLRDYLYFPLGGSKKGTVRTYVNLVIVMAVSGLWHGAGWTFVLWGVLHGLYSCTYRLVDSLSGKRLSSSKGGFLSVLQTAVNFVIVSLLWVFFRADDVSSSLTVIGRCFTYGQGICQPYTWSFIAILIETAAVIAAVAVCKKRGESKPTVLYPRLNLSKVYGMVLFFVFIGITLILGYYGDTAFIYGAF